MKEIVLSARSLGHCGSVIRTSVRCIVTEGQEKRVSLAKIKLARADLAGAAEILILRVGTFSKNENLPVFTGRALRLLRRRRTTVHKHGRTYG